MSPRMNGKTCFSHRPKAQWPKCKGCGRACEALTNGQCAACNDPATYALCQQIAKAERELAAKPGRGRRDGSGRFVSAAMERELAALEEYGRWIRRVPDPSIVSLLLDRTSADNGKRGGPKGGER